MGTPIPERHMLPLILHYSCQLQIQMIFLDLTTTIPKGSCLCSRIAASHLVVLHIVCEANTFHTQMDFSRCYKEARHRFKHHASPKSRLHKQWFILHSETFPNYYDLVTWKANTSLAKQCSCKVVHHLVKLLTEGTTTYTFTKMGGLRHCHLCLRINIGLNIY